MSAESAKATITEKTQEMFDIIGISNVKKPLVDILIGRMTRNTALEGSMKFEILCTIENSKFKSHRFIDKDLVDDGTEFDLIDTLGVQVDNASVYGKTAEVSFAEQNNWMFQNVKSGDIILINTYLEEQMAQKVNLEDYVKNVFWADSIVARQVLREKAYANIDFHGFITIKTKNLKSTEQFRIEAIDIIRMLQQVNVPVGLETYEYGVMNHMTNLFLKGFINAIARNKINIISDEVNDLAKGGINYEKNIKYFDVSKYVSIFEPFKKFAWELLEKVDPEHAMEDVYVYKVFQNDDEDTVIYSVYISAIKAVEFIFQFVLEKLGMTDYFDIVTIVDKHFAEQYNKYFADKRGFPTSFINLNLYFRNTGKSSSKIDITNIFPNDNINPKELMKNLSFYTTGKLIDFSDAMFDKDKMSEDLEEFCYYNIGAIEGVVSDFKFFNTMQAVREDAIKSLELGIRKSKSRFHKNIIRVNKTHKARSQFFDFVNYEKTAIRAIADKQNTFASNDKTQNGIPITQVMNYALSLFMTRLYYYNQDAEPIGNNYSFRGLRSKKFLYSMSQITWFNSAFVAPNNDLDNDSKARFVIFPTMTPKLKSAEWLFNEENKNVLKKSDTLEMEFIHVDMTNNIMRIVKEFPKKSNDANENLQEPHIFFNTNQNDDILNEIYDQKFPFKIASFGENILDLEDKVTKRGLDLYTNFFSNHMYVYYGDNFADTTADWTFKYPHVWFDKGDFYFHADSDTIEQKKNVIRLFTESWLAPKTSSPAEIEGMIINPYPAINFKGLDTLRKDSGFEEDDFSGKIIGINSYFGGLLSNKLAFVLPSYYVKGGKIRYDKVDFFKKNNEPYTTLGLGTSDKKYKSRFQVKVYFDKLNYLPSKDPIFGRENGFLVNFNIAGVTEHWDIPAIKDAIENELFYYDGLPDDIRDSVNLIWKKYDIKDTLLEDLEQLFSDDILDLKRKEDFEIINMSDAIDYARDLIKRVEELVNDGIGIAPSSAVFYPDFYEILNTVVNTKSNPNNILSVDVKPDKNKNMREFMSLLMQDLYDLLITPLTLFNGQIDNASFPPFDRDNAEAYNNHNILDVIKFDGGLRLDTESKSTMEIFVINRFIQEIFTLSFIYYEFVEDVLRKNIVNGNVFLANNGLDKYQVGDYVYLANDVPYQNLVLQDATDFFETTVKKIASTILPFGEIASNTVDKAEDIIDNYINEQDLSAAVYSTSVNNTTDITKPFGWFVWKTITYLGSSSEASEGTSGYNQKVYLARDGVRFGGKIEEKDIAFDLTKALGRAGAFNQKITFNL